MYAIRTGRRIQTDHASAAADIIRGKANSGNPESMFQSFALAVVGLRRRACGKQLVP